MTTARSDKPYKVAEHRRERHSVSQALRSGADNDDPALHRVYGDPWNAPKDGLQHIGWWPPSHFTYECMSEKPEYMAEEWWNVYHPNHFSRRGMRK